MNILECSPNLSVGGKGYNIRIETINIPSSAVRLQRLIIVEKSPKHGKTAIAASALFALLSFSSIPAGAALDKVMTGASAPAETRTARKEAEDPADVVTVDEESRSPEGSSFAASSIYMRVGDEYKSTRRSVPRSLIDQIRQVALASQSKTTPGLKEFGITEASVLQNREVMLDAAYTKSRGKARPHPPFEALPSEIKQQFSYETVASNALAEITGAMNSAYSCIRVSVPGDPPLVLISHHEQSGSLPWRVIAGGHSWRTYSRELPKLLAQIASPSMAEYLAGDEPAARFQFRTAVRSVRTAYWPDGFFRQYDKWTRDQIESYEAINAAKEVPGWAEASNHLNIEDAVKWDEGMLVLVGAKDSQMTVDKAIIDIDKPSEASPKSFANWTEVIAWYRTMENDAASAKWLKAWREAGAGRSVRCVWSKRAHSNAWQFDSTEEFWRGLGLPDKPRYCFQLFKDGVHCGDVLVGDPLKYSVLSNLGPGGGPTARLPKVMRLTSVSPLRTFENGEEPFDERNWAVIDSQGKQIKKAPVSIAYALRSGFPPPHAEDRSFDYRWPVDFAEEEDLEYLDEKIEGEDIESVSPPHEDVLYGLVSKEGKILLEPKYRFIGPFSEGLARVWDGDKKVGYVDRSGTVVIKMQFGAAETFYEGLAAVRKDGKWGFIDKTGNLAIPYSFDSVRRFSEGVAPARRGAKFGYIDKTGRFVIPQQFGRARHFVGGLAYVQIDGQRAYIDHAGKPIGGKMYDVLERFAEGRAVFRLKGKYGYIDEKGLEVIGPQFTKASAFRNGVAEVMVGSTRQSIDCSGKFVKQPPTHSDFWEGPITEGLIRTQEKWKYGFKNRSGKFVIRPSFDQAGVFANGFCPVQVGEKWGVIDTAGNLVIQPQFEELHGMFSEHLIAARTGKKWGVIDEKGAVVVKPLYDRIFPFSNGMAIIQDGLKFGYINAKGEVVFAPQFDAAHQFDDKGIAHVSKRVHELEVDALP